MLTLVYAYYDNPHMLAEQYRAWTLYPLDLQHAIRIVIVDDASPRWPAADVPRPPVLPVLAIYRVAVDLPWHQDGARNLGAHVADTEWLLLTDMDHVVPLDTALWAAFGRHDETAFYTFARLDAPLKIENKKRHPNSYLMTRAMYWQAGGYDEDMTGVYGTDAAFRRQLDTTARERPSPYPLIRYSREIIADASTTTLERKGRANERRRQEARERKLREGRAGKIVTLNFDWTRAL